MALINCRHFNGYKPCGKNSSCDEGCSAQDLIKKNVLIIHLGALGSVVRTSALLRKFQNSYVVWLTSESVLPILKNHPAVDQLYALNLVNLLKLQAMSFDDIYVIDKSLEAVSVATQLKAKRVHGFKANPLNGAILPISEQANELWQIGLDNSKKFFENKKTELQLIFESLGFSYNNEPYWLHLTEAEKSKALKRKQTWLQQHNKKIIVGINTGCSTMIPYKKLSMQKHLELITEMQNSFKNIQIVLLGGQEDTGRNQILASSFADVIASDSQSGLRDGIISVQACDIVISGDSLGMHLAIALNKYTIAWFGPTCDHEIDLFGFGRKISTYLNCSPCWKRTCSNENMCYDHVHIGDFISALEEGISKVGSGSRTNSTEENSYLAHSLPG